MPRRGLGTSGPAPRTRGRSVARTQTKVFTGDGFAPQNALALCSAPDLRA